MHIGTCRYSPRPVFRVRTLIGGLLLACGAAPALAQISVWRADGSAIDNFGVNHGIPTAITYVPDQFGGEAFSLGGSSVITIPNPVEGGLAKDQGFTIMAWVKPSSFAGAAGASFFNVRPVANNAGFTFETDTSNARALKFYVHQAGLFRFVLSEPVLELDTWSHVTATFDAFFSRMRVFHNGKLVASRDDLPPNAPMTLGPNFACEIGRNIVINSFAFRGAIDNVRYYEGEMNGCELRTYLGLPPCVADRNCDGAVDLNDYFQFFNCFDLTLPCADVDGSGDVDLGDYFEFFNSFDTGC